MWSLFKLKIGVIIPARFDSKRLPGKILKDFLGMPMLEHVWRRAQLADPVLETIIATDSIKIKKIAEEFGAACILTSKNHNNGLSRVGELAHQLQWDYYIVLQADEILIEPESLNTLAKITTINSHFKFFNLITKLTFPGEINDLNIVKCLIRENNTVITMGRKSNSIAQESDQMQYTKKLCGVYSCSNELLIKLANTPAQKIETAESIEQMKVIEMGYSILGVLIDKSYPSVNTSSEAVSALHLLQTDLQQKNILSTYKQ